MKYKEVNLVNSFKYLAMMVVDWLFPNLAKKISYFYWMTSDKVHSDTSWESYNTFYSRIKEIVNPLENELILDAACGTGELTYLFLKDGYRIKGCDFSDYLICKAKLNFQEVDFYLDDLMLMDNTHEKFNKIFLNGAILYIHPKILNKVAFNLYSILKDDGKLFLFDWPDYEKKGKIHNKLACFLISLLPVYQPKGGGFWYKKKWIKKSFEDAGFKEIEFLDSWANYRSHAICKK